MDYENMSDFEINKRVAETLCCTIHDYRNGNPIIDSITGKVFDPCNNSSDAWPIIFVNRIRITPRYSDSSWYADFAPMCIESNGDNPLRAAMIVYLMMQEAKC